ncbi:MAG: ribose-phosphate pyrophosphokinase [Alphaproteobacteria bacterium]
MPPPLVVLQEGDPFGKRLAGAIGAEVAQFELRRFPDGETYLRYDTPPGGRSVVILCSLDRPDGKFLPLLFAAATARDLGAKSVGLVSPYLPYMRQDRRFRPGEAVTSAYFAEFLSDQFDWLVTIDPHLHRRSSLSEIYSMRTAVLHAAPLIAEWIRKNIEFPLLIGPDEESEQWVADVGRDAGAPHLVLQKIRHGDREVDVSIPDTERWRDRTPVIVDDIISSGHTLIETVGHLVRADMKPPICVAVHGLFAEGSYQKLVQAGAARIVTSNTISHETNAIDVTSLLAVAVGELIGLPAPVASRNRRP